MPAARRTRARGLPLVNDYSEATLSQFLHQLARQKNKRVEGVSELTRQQLHSLCVALSSLVERAGPDYWPVEAAHDPDLNRQTIQNAARTLLGAAALVMELLTERGNEAPSEQLLAVAQQLHGFLLAYYGEPTWDLEMMDAVAQMCFTWWERKALYREELVARTIPYVLVRAANGLHDKGKATWVHIVYAMRDALDLLDFEDDNINDTKHMLLVVAREPAFLRSPEGRRFIAFLFKLHPSLAQEVAAIARNQIAGGQQWVLEAYGEIFFRAWRDTVGPCAAEVENELQRLMQAAILATTPRLAASLRLVLKDLHGHKSVEKRVAPLMVRLYDPILPRAFGAANAEVRRNAVNLLVAAFPILDPEAPAAENNTRMTQQMSLLMESLVDSCPAVREAAVVACCDVLNRYWELIPAATSAKIMSDITTKLAYDGASKTVRVAVLQGLHKLVDNQNAQPVLKKALTGVTALLHDSDPAVREALMDLVLAVTNCRGFKFWELIPPEALLEAVAADADEGVARKIVRLLLPSYFPNADSGAACMAALLRANPGAAQALCRQLVACYLPAAASSGFDGAGGRLNDLGVSVPLELLVQVASTLAAHLAATAGSLQTAEEAGAAGPASPPAKRTKAASGRRGKKGAGASSAAVAGKKRAKKKEAQPEPDEEEEADADEQHGESGAAGAASRGAAAADAAADEDDDVVLVQARETPDSWVNILGGLALLVEGLGAAVTVRGVDGTEVAAVFDEAGLEELLRAAEDDVRRPEAIRLVLRMVASLHFLPAAARVRALLYRRMARGCIAGLGSVPAGVVDEATADLGAAAHWDDPELVAEVLKTLATGHHAPKLFAMLASALQARKPLPVRQPRNADTASCKGKHGKAHDGLMAELLGLDSAGHEAEGDGWEHDVICVSCKCAEPSDTMLLCDGCDLGCHINCMRPALAEVPAGDWLCWRCEAQVQGTALPAAAAGRCVALLLQMDEPRQLLCSHELFPHIIEKLKELADEEGGELLDLVNASANGGAGTDEASSAPTDSAAAAAAGAAAMVRAALLGDPWGAMTRYCRASLHRAMWAAMPQPLEAAEDSDEEDEEEEEELAEEEDQGAGRKRRGGGKKMAAAARTPAPAARGGRRSSAVTPARPGAALAEEDRTSIIFEGVAAIDYACQACNELVSRTLEKTCGLAEHLAVLHYCQGLLRVLHVVQQTGLVTCTPDWVAGAANFCGMQAALIRAAAGKLAAAAASDSSGAASAAAERLQQQAQLAGSLQVLLGVVHQLAETVRRSPSHDTDTAAAGVATPGPVRRRLSSEGASEEEVPLSQQLEGRLQAAAAEAGGEQQGAEPRAAAPSGALVEGLSVGLVELLCDAALAPLLRGAVRVAAADLLGELLAAPRRAARCGWLDTLCRLTGEALSSDPSAAAELSALLQPDAGEVQPAQPQEQQPQPENNEDAAMPEAGEGPQPDGAVRGVLPSGRGAGSKKGKAEATGGKTSGSGGASTATALQDLLSRINPAVGVMANMLERVCAARKAHGRAMLLLASVAAKSLAAPQEAGDTAQQRKQPAPGASALGATVLLWLCQAMAPAEVTSAGVVEGHAAQRTDARRRGGPAGGRYGALAQEAAAQAVREEAKAAARALGVVRRVLDVGRALQPLQPQQQAAGAGGSEGLVARTLLQTVLAVATR